MEGTSMIIIAIGALVCLLIGTIILVVFYSGLLDQIVVGAGKPPVQNLKVAYKFGRGPYKNCGEVFTEASAVGPDNCRCVGLYYDDPEQVPSHKLRWAVGCILAEGKEDPDAMVVERCRKEGFQFFQFPAVTNCVKTTFPYRTSLSIFMAIFRVYPALSRYVQNHKLCAHPWLEIYAGNVIHFMGPLARQDEFYVPESVVEDNEDEKDEESEIDEMNREDVLEKGQGDGPHNKDTSPELVTMPCPGDNEHSPLEQKICDKDSKQETPANSGEATPVLADQKFQANVRHQPHTNKEDMFDHAKSEIPRAKTEQVSSRSLAKRLETRKDLKAQKPRKAASVGRSENPKTLPSKAESDSKYTTKTAGPGLVANVCRPSADTTDVIQDAVVSSTANNDGTSDSGLASETDLKSESDISAGSPVSSRTSVSTSNTTSDVSSFSLLTGTSDDSSPFNSETTWGSSRLTEFSSDSASDKEIGSSFEDLTREAQETETKQVTKGEETARIDAAQSSNLIN